MGHPDQNLTRWDYRFITSTCESLGTVQTFPRLQAVLVPEHPALVPTPSPRQTPHRPSEAAAWPTARTLTHWLRCLEVGKLLADGSKGSPRSQRPAPTRPPALPCTRGSLWPRHHAHLHTQ